MTHSFVAKHQIMSFKTRISTIQIFSILRILSCLTRRWVCILNRKSWLWTPIAKTYSKTAQWHSMKTLLYLMKKKESVFRSANKTMKFSIAKWILLFKGQISQTIRLFNVSNPIKSLIITPQNLPLNRKQTMINLLCAKTTYKSTQICLSYTKRLASSFKNLSKLRKTITTTIIKIMLQIKVLQVPKSKRASSLN